MLFFITYSWSVLPLGIKSPRGSRVDRFKKFVGVSVGLPLWFVGSLALLASVVLMIGRIVIWLKDGRWLSSICSVGIEASNYIRDFPVLCGFDPTGWKAIDRLDAWLVQALDPSLILFLVSVLSIGIATVVATATGVEEAFGL